MGPVMVEFLKDGVFSTSVRLQTGESCQKVGQVRVTHIIQTKSCIGNLGLFEQLFSQGKLVSDLLTSCHI